MARRIYMAANDGTGKAIVRHSKPGIDAKFATPDQCLFDGDSVPLIRVGGGTELVEARKTVAVPDRTFNHGLSRKPDFVFAIARPIRAGTADADVKWGSVNTQLSSISEAYCGDMHGRYCPPFGAEILNYNAYTGMNYRQNTGWFFRFNATQIIVTVVHADFVNNSIGQLRVKWSAYNVSV